MAFDLINWSAINWNAPWLMPYKPIGIRLAEHVLSGSPVHVALNEVLDSNPQINCPVSFVPQEESSGAAAYESFIWQTKTVPTRHNLHDFFNGLVWLHFPKTKARLNELQAAAIQAAGVTQTRGKGIQTTRGVVRDALTLFDENAAFLIEAGSQSPLLQAIQNKAWQDAFVARRTEWASASVVIFGHALLEKLVSPRKNMTAHVFCSPVPMQTIDDTLIASALDAAHLAAKPYAPLPVLGIPKWCAENENPIFYEDASVFRPLSQNCHI